MGIISVTDWHLVPSGDWDWPHFMPEEMACHEDGSLMIDTRLLDILEGLRRDLGFALPVSSGYRSPSYNAKVSETGDGGPHTTGKAADIRVMGQNAYSLVTAAAHAGIVGLGISQKGSPGARFVHLDILPIGVKDVPRPWVWTY